VLDNTITSTHVRTVSGTDSGGWRIGTGSRQVKFTEKMIGARG
jgi:hypothetical protein